MCSSCARGVYNARTSCVEPSTFTRTLSSAHVALRTKPNLRTFRAQLVPAFPTTVFSKTYSVSQRFSPLYTALTTTTTI
jgi:hypothetical protein